jgi:hypothetical protein
LLPIYVKQFVRHDFGTVLSHIASLLMREVLLICALKFWQSEFCDRDIFLADYDSSYFVLFVLVEKFYGSDMLLSYEIQTTHLFHHLNPLHD